MDDQGDDIFTLFGLSDSDKKKYDISSRNTLSNIITKFISKPNSTSGNNLQVNSSLIYHIVHWS